eukprot:1555583-Rhodomonas_salina.1
MHRRKRRRREMESELRLTPVLARSGKVLTVWRGGVAAEAEEMFDRGDVTQQVLDNHTGHETALNVQTSFRCASNLPLLSRSLRPLSSPSLSF